MRRLKQEKSLHGVCFPPDPAPCSIEKVAINAVMAGCKPEYMPVLLALEPVLKLPRAG